jgi:hypothetical protein
MHRLFWALAVGLFLVLGASSRAEAYPWMIRHEYTGCSPCHADPSGGSLLTPYGRAQSELLLETRWRSGGEDQEPSRTTGLLWGVWTPPDWLLLGGFARSAYMGVDPSAGPTVKRFVFMQYDAAAGIRAGGFRASAMLGYLPKLGETIAVTNNGQGKNLVSREHWVGYAWGDDTWLVRAGRINVPFGIRNVEHTAWIRVASRANYNDGQQHGVNLAFTRGPVRAEVMGIAGNYQLRSDRQRERGYSMYVEWAPVSRAAVGASSMITHASEDRILGSQLTRHAHGGFVRAAALQALVLFAEVDAIVHTMPQATYTGYAGWLQADAEPWQGVHVISTVEMQRIPGGLASPALGTWFSIAWFFAPHADLRLDAISQRFPGRYGSSLLVNTYLAQAHVWL